MARRWVGGAILGRGALLVLVVGVWVAGPVGGFAQAGAGMGGKAPAFEVVSIRQNKSSGPCSSMQAAITPDGYHLKNCPLMIPILTVYTPTDMGDAGFYRDVTGAPEWMNAERYDIEAKVAEADLAAWQNSTTRNAMLRAMLQTLLVERCKLAVHRETKEVSAYALVIGKNGPRLKAAESTDAQVILRKHPDGGTIPGGLGGAVLVANPVRGQFNLYGSSTKTLALLLTHFAGERPVIDKTGLTGSYDIELQMSVRPDAAASDAPDMGPSVFTAVQEQLGLKLEPTRGTVETLVIDHFERPTEN